MKQLKLGMIHYNLKQQPNLLEQFYKLQDDIEKEDHPLAINYSRKNLNLKDFPFFNCVTKDEKIIAFGGLQKTKWGKKIGRVATRLWVHKDYRKKGGVPSSFNSTILMPNQILWAEQNDYDLVYWSRQYPHQRHFKVMIDRSNRNCPYKYVHKPLPDIYNVCKDSDNQNCWQRVAVVELKTNKIPFDEKHTKKSD